MAKPNKRLQKFTAAKKKIKADQKQQIAMLRQRSAQMSAVWLDWFNNHPNNPNGPLYHFDAQGQLIRGAHETLLFFENIWGDCTNTYGICPRGIENVLHGDVSGLSGKVDEAKGDATGMRGEIPRHGIDFNDIPMEARAANPDIAYWVARLAAAQANPT
jgi:hypothetical protein